MAKRALPAVIGGLALTLALLAGCGGGSIDENLATFNARATQIAEGAIVGEEGTPAPATPEPTPIPNLIDLTTDPNAQLARAWSQVLALRSGDEFTIIATQEQVGAFIIDTLQLYGMQSTVRGGSAAIGAAQIRIDLALVDQEGNFGAGTVSFQPTLDELGRLHLNPQPAQFGGLDLPAELLPLIGDAVYTALTGARNDAQSRVTLTRLTLENGIMELSGIVR